MQRGLATLEIILVTVIIGVLVKVAVPNVARIIDTAALDYETKRLYSELRFIEEMNRSSRIVPTGTGTTNLLVTSAVDKGGENIILNIKRNENCYQVFRGNSGKIPLREPHYFSYGVKIKLESGTDTIIKIYFDSDGKATINNKKSDTLILTSRLGKKKYIIFDSVGRMRASLTPAAN